MPKKTKKQKIIASYRKKIRLVQNNLPKNEKPETAKTQKTANKPEIEIKEKNYFLSDLKKSIFLVVLVIMVEIILYFARIIR